MPSLWIGTSCSQGAKNHHQENIRGREGDGMTRISRTQPVEILS